MRRGLPILAALLVRLLAVLASDRMTADVLRYHKVAAHVLDVSWNPYEAPRLYPYPPVWVWFEAGSEYLSRRGVLSFPVLVKLPVLAAELAIVVLLLGWGRERGSGDLPAWLYALHPAAVLISGFHGQFDAIALLFLLLSLRWREQGRLDRSALALSAGIAVKSFPILVLPFLVLSPGISLRGRVRFVALAVLPVALILLPCAVDDVGALGRELLGYGGIADFGWIGLYRGIEWLWTGTLPRSEAAHWGALIPAAKLAFLLTYGAMVVAFSKGRLRWSPAEAVLGALLSFLVLYGAVSAQYLLWVVPLGALLLDRHLAGYSAAATLALLGFYAFLAPGVLHGGDPWAYVTREHAGWAWVAGVAAVAAATALWLIALLRRGLR